MKIEALFKKLSQEADRKQNLLFLKEELKQTKKEGNQPMDSLLSHITEFFPLLCGLLKDEDPKIRKNTAQIMGLLAEEDFLNPLFLAYQSEEQRYVRATYLEAIKELDYKEILEDLKKCKTELEGKTVKEEEKKHWLLEIRALMELVDWMEGRDLPIFTKDAVTSDVLLLANRNQKAILLPSLAGLRHKEMPAGVLVRTDQPKDLFRIRTFEEMLFLMEDLRTCGGEPKEAANSLLEGGLLSYLDQRHTESGIYYVRIEVKSKEPEIKREYGKKLGAELEIQSGRRIINSVSDYDLELRLIEKKEGGFFVMLKLFTLPDFRFDYREGSVAASIRPVHAALTIALAADYLKKEAIVLDPFCGVGTMLLERDKFEKTRRLYGVDLYEEAIRKARKNALLAGVKDECYFIKRDFFDFQLDTLPDEIITNLPFQTEKQGREVIMSLYQRFFQRAALLLKSEKIMVLHTRDRKLVEKYSQQFAFQIEKQYELSKAEGTYVIILRKR